MPKFVDKISYLDTAGVEVDLNQTQNVTTTTLADMADTLLEMIYPIGSIYISTNNVSPQNFLGGTWSRFANGQVLVGVNESEGDFSSVLKTGGSKEHKLTVDQLPSHGHAGLPHTHGLQSHVHNFTYTRFDNPNWFNRNLAQYDNQAYIPCSENPKGTDLYKAVTSTTAAGGNGYTDGVTAAVSATGGSQPHNNLQPYITVYMWRRTA